MWPMAGRMLLLANLKKPRVLRSNCSPCHPGKCWARLRAEKANPQTDMWFGGGSDAFIQAREEDLIAAYISPNAENVNPAFRDEEGYWTGVSIVVVGLLVNNNRLNDKGLPLPKKWSDLADPVYKDEVMASNPNTSGTAYTTVSGILQIMGEEQGWEFLDKMYANIPYLEKSGSGPAKKALAGEYAIGIVPDPHITLIDNPDAPLDLCLPDRWRVGLAFTSCDHSGRQTSEQC